MKKKQNEGLLMSKDIYQAPKVEVFHLGSNLSFLEQGFSSNGELDPLKEGYEIGVDDDEYPIG